MMLLDAAALFQTAPELASLETLALVLRSTLAALTAAHTCLASGHHRCAALAPCHLAHAIHDGIEQLDHAILHYRALAQDAIEDELRHEPPF